ncbi:MAG TPA: TorF family putative porin, partial [Steroidobacteraceae bacterium]
VWQAIGVTILCGTGLTLCPPAALAQADELGGFVALTSNYIYRGATETANDPALQVDLHYYAVSGWITGLWASNVRQSAAAPTGVEFDPYLGYGFTFSDRWSARLSAVEHVYAGTNPSSTADFTEISGTVAYRSAAFLTLSVSPNTLTQYVVYDYNSGYSYDSIRRTALTADFSLHRSFGHAFSVNAGLGYYRLAQQYSSGYGYGSAGLAYEAGAWHLDLSFIGVSGAAHDFYANGEACNRLIGTALWHF